MLPSMMNTVNMMDRLNVIYSNILPKIYNTLNTLNSNISWAKIKELHNILFSVIQDVKDKPSDLPTGFIIVGGIIVTIIVGATLIRLLYPKADKKTEEENEEPPVLDIYVKNDYPWENGYLSFKELLTWMSIHNIPRPTRVLFLILQQSPVLRNISIHSICNVQKVDYLLRVHQPGNPYNLASLPFDIDPEVSYFFIPADENDIVEIMHAVNIMRSSRSISRDEKRHAAQYRHKLETILMYENRSYRPRYFF